MTMAFAGLSNRKPGWRRAAGMRLAATGPGDKRRKRHEQQRGRRKCRPDKVVPTPNGVDSTDDGRETKRATERERLNLVGTEETTTMQDRVG